MSSPRSASTLLHTPSCPLPAVDHDERRRVREAPLARRGRLVPLLEQPGEPPPEHLLHAGEVVLPGHALDLELAVVASASGRPSSNTTIEPTLSRRPQVGDVVALDPQRRLRQAELVGELGERAGARPEVATRAAACADGTPPPRSGSRPPSACAWRRAPARRSAPWIPAPRGQPRLAARRDRRAASGPGPAAGPPVRSM